MNTDSSAHLVTVVETQSGTTVGSFTMPAGSVEFLEKQYTHCVFAANAGVRGDKSRIYTLRKMKLITEEISSVKFITEGKGAKKKMYIEGVFLQGDIKNRNGRMYPVGTLSKEVERYNESFVQKGRALGELGHPDGPTVNLDRVSHKITSLKQEEIIL